MSPYYSAGNGLELYLSHMQQIEQAKYFFEEHNPSSPELAKAVSIVIHVDPLYDGKCYTYA